MRKDEEKVHKAGFHWGWEEEPPAWYREQKKGQGVLPGLDTTTFRHLCASCDARLAAEQAINHHE